MAVKGPRGNKTSRRQKHMTVLLAELTQTGPAEWTFPGAEFVCRYDEHDRAWVITRIDGKPTWYGSRDWDDDKQEWVKVETEWTLVRSIRRGVMLLRSLGYLDDPYKDMKP